MVNPTINAAAAFLNIIGSLPGPIFDVMMLSWVLGIVAVVVNVFLGGK